MLASFLRAWATTVLLGLFAGALVPAAEAQTGGPFFSLQVAATPSDGLITKSLGRVDYTFQVTVRYDASNPAAGQFMVNVTVEPITTTFPEGWQVSSPSVRQFNMRPSETRLVTLSVSLLTDRPADDRLAVELRFASQPYASNPSPLPIPNQFPAQLQQADTKTVRVTAEKRLTVSETVTGLARDYAPWLGGVAIALFILGVVVAKRRRAVAVLVLSCDQPRQQIVPGRGASFPVRVLNGTSEREEIRLELEDVPMGWEALLPLHRFDLGAGASTQVWLTLKAPDDARVGSSAHVRLVASPVHFPERSSEVRLEAEVIGGYSAGAPPEEPIEAAPQPLVASKRRVRR